TGDELARSVIATVVVIGLFAIAYIIAARAGERFVTRLARQGEPGIRAVTLWSQVRRLLAVAVVVTALLTILSAVWKLPIAPFLAVGSAVGVALGLGAQKLVQDVIAGFFVLLEDQFRIGDVVKIGGTSGEVQEVRLRVTVLRDVSGNVHYVPNGEIRVATNMTQGFARVVLDISVVYDNDLDRALTALEDEFAQLAGAEEWKESFLEPPEVLSMERLVDSGVVLRVIARVRPADRWAIEREALRRIKARFDQEGIALPAPPLTFYRTDGAGTST
ncbi:MAG: mechanosensitive ion channel family protein, partial [Acidimicrobiia bacterium]